MDNEEYKEANASITKEGVYKKRFERNLSLKVAYIRSIDFSVI